MRYEIKNGCNKTYYCRKELKDFNCLFKKTGKYTGYWYIDTEDQFLANRLQAFCLKNNLTFIPVESSYSRNSHYRNDFFLNNPPLIKNGKAYYRCVYCGRLFPKNQITVDHLFPVAKVKSSYNRNLYRKLLKKFEITNINDEKNLVPACLKCNKRKSKKTGIWLLRGIIGKYEIFWKILYYAILFLVLVGFLFIFLNYK